MAQKTLAQPTKPAIDRLTIGTRYLWKRSGEWVINGHTDRWLVYITPTGWNGAGGLWVNEDWHWEHSGQRHHTQPRSLSYEDTMQMGLEIAALASQEAHDG